MSRLQKILRLEWLALLILVGVLYFSRDYSTWLFVVLLLAPDVFMVGYLKDTRLGALTYNIGHTVFLPLILLLISTVTDSELALQSGLIWFAHIAMDRTFGYGLKHSDNFKHTHLGWIGGEDTTT